MGAAGPPPRRKPRFRERHAAGMGAAPVVERPLPSVQSAPPPPAPRRRVLPRRVAPPTVTVQGALYVLILAVAFLLRVWDLGARAMHGDESVHAWMAWNLFTGQGYAYDPVYHGPLQFPVTAAFFFLFSDSETTGRLSAALLGTALVGLPYFLRHYMGRAAALLSAAIIAISPEFVYDSRLERDDAYTVFFAMVLAIAIFGYLRTRQSRYVYLGAAAASLSLAAMENTYITLFVFGAFIILMIVGEVLPRSPLLGVISKRAVSPSGLSGPLGWPAIGVTAVLLVVALVLSIATGLYPPAPAVVALVLIALVLRQSVVDSQLAGVRPFWTTLQSISRMQWINAATIIVAVLVLLYSTFGTNPRGLWDAAQPFFNNGSCPNNPFPLNPCRKDIIGGLFYWLSQHQVARGGQPWFYYSFLFGLYEQVTLLFGLAGLLYFLRRPSLFTTFVTFWAVAMFGIYSWAGEKFPWLLVHPLLPFTLLAGMFIVRLFTMARPVVIGGLVILAALTILELHSTYEVNFVNGADPVEMMVYVQSAPDTPVVARQIETLSYKVKNDLSMPVTIDSTDTWPFAWYLRHMTAVSYPSPSQLAQKPYSTSPVIIADTGDVSTLDPMLHGKYSRREEILRWWFPEDYKQLSWGTFAHDAVNPGYWSVIWQWLTERRPFGPKGRVTFYYYVKHGIASPF